MTVSQLAFGVVKNNLDVQGSLRARDTNLTSLVVSGTTLCSGALTASAATINGTSTITGLSLFNNTTDVGVDSNGKPTASIISLGGGYFTKKLSTGSTFSCISDASIGGALVVSGLSTLATVSTQAATIKESTPNFSE